MNDSHIDDFLADIDADNTPELPSEQECAAIVAALDEASEAAERVIRRMDALHRLLEDTIREVREAREILAAGNAISQQRSVAR